jgi:agmatine deiminase
MAEPKLSPKQLGYSFPAEWSKHRATWLSYPHEDSYSWPGTLERIFPFYNQFIRELSESEQVCINVRSELHKAAVYQNLEAAGVKMPKITLLVHPTNDAWCRDHGPAFLLNPAAKDPRVIVSWKYNAWGNKYTWASRSFIPESLWKAVRSTLMAAEPC